MYCVFCDKTIQWIEVHLQHNHQIGLLQYLRDYFQVPVAKQDYIQCYSCPGRVKWLQDHLLNKHQKLPLLEYAFKYYILRDEYEKKVEEYRKVALETKPRVEEKKTRIKELSEVDLEVLGFQEGKVPFLNILKRWIGPIRVQLSKSHNLIVDLSKQEAIKDLEQELHAVLYTAAKKYNSEKAVFNTYAWNCINSHLATIASYNKANKRSFKMIGAEDVLRGQYKDEEVESNDKVSLLHYLNTEDNSSENNTRVVEFYDRLDDTNTTQLERLIIQGYLNNLTRAQITTVLNLELSVIDKTITSFKGNQQLKRFLQKTF